MRWSKLFKALWGLYKVPLTLVTLCVLAMVIGANVFGLETTGAHPRPHASAPPRSLLGRVWFDHYPESSRDTNSYAIFLSGGIGLVESGSVWRSSSEIFDFERRGSTLDIELIQDGSTTTTGFTIEGCDDRPPFDLCLILDENPTGGSDPLLHVRERGGLREPAALGSRPRRRGANPHPRRPSIEACEVLPGPGRSH